MGKKDYHAEGEKDGAKNEYHSPISTLQPLFGTVTEQDLKDKETYDKGYDNGKKQRGY